MLDPWIIEEIRRREQEERQQEQRPVLEIPLESPPYLEHDGRPEPYIGPTSDEERGVLIVDF